MRISGYNVVYSINMSGFYIFYSEDA